MNRSFIAQSLAKETVPQRAERMEPKQITAHSYENDPRLFQRFSQIRSLIT
jgi:hypothetical protein